MVRKTAKPQTDTPQDSSTNPVWLAGLGAFSKAQEEGSKVLEALVREGTAIQRKTQAAAEEKMAEAAERIASMAGDMSHRAQGQWGKLEGIFEDRVAQALHRLGVPTAQEVQALRDRVATLEKQLAAAQRPARKAPRRTPRD